MRYSALDMSAYPPPDAIETLDYEAALAARKAAFMASFDQTKPTPEERSAMQAMLDYEYEPLVALLEQDAYCDTIFTARLNDKVRAVLLATAFGATLDHIAATYYRQARRAIAPADPINSIAAVMEDDDTFRQRLALSPESWSCAGPEGAYLFFALIDGVLDAACYSEDEGACLAPTVRAPVLSSLNGGSVAPQSLLDAVSAALNKKEIRPIGDRVLVESATPLFYNVSVTLLIQPGASAQPVIDAARKNIAAYVAGRIRWAGDGVNGPVWLIGRRIRLGTLAAAASVAGVAEVIVNAPTADVNAPAAGYDAALPLPINAVAPLDPALTAHLFRAPICQTIDIQTQIAPQGWSS